jgi:hypothetical protein
MNITHRQYVEQAIAIANLADAIATDSLIGPHYAAVARLVDMVDTLRVWTEDDRSQASS